MKPYCITFAGVVGNSKTPIAHYLSIYLDIPVFSNDVVRTEVTEDLGRFDQNIYVERKDQRIKDILKSKKSFVLDASVDREWVNVGKILKGSGYETFIISLDLSNAFLQQLYKAKGSVLKEGYFELLVAQHSEFLKIFNGVVNLHITDDLFKNRLKLSLQAVRKWLNKGVSSAR